MSRQAAGIALLAMALATGLLTGCVIGDPGPRGVIGFQRGNEAGQVLVRVRSCDSAAEVARVQLIKSTGQAGQSGPVLWAIEQANGGSTARAFVVDGAVEGYEEVVPLEEALSDSQQYIVDVEFVASYLNLRASFTPQELEADRWFTRGELRSESEFTAVDFDCGGLQRSPVAD